ncbi:MAG: hypothetical protein C0631_02665 [Sedimenticola sp.]|nr:MAG: hypothetical protein C0631_02665 [Sedimenticola sp.]
MHGRPRKRTISIRSIRSVSSLWSAQSLLARRSANWTLVNTLYEDRGFSGGHLRRLGFHSLIADIKRGLVDVMVVHRLDRLTRILSDFQQIIAEHECEMVGQCVKDKRAATLRNGRWQGASCPMDITSIMIAWLWIPANPKSCRKSLRDTPIRNQ